MSISTVQLSKTIQMDSLDSTNTRNSHINQRLSKLSSQLSNLLFGQFRKSLISLKKNCPNCPPPKGGSTCLMAYTAPLGESGLITLEF